MFNKVILIGRLARDPELRYTTDGTAVVNFTLAVDRYAKAGEEKKADFIRIVAWRKLAETCANNLSKGRLVAVDGRLQIGSYEDKDGAKRTTVDVVVSEVKFLDYKKNTETEGDPYYGSMDAEDPEVPF